MSTASGPNATWDALHVHVDLARLTMVRGHFRLLRLLHRLRSPRRIIATTLALAFFVVFVLNGVFVLSARAPTDPARLKLWLSGGMVIYALYHVVRCVWSKRIADLQWSAAESLWLGGGPLARSSMAVYHISNTIIAAGLKTLYLAVVLACDVSHLELMLVGVFSSLVLLETIRLVIQRWSAGLDDQGRNRMRAAATVVASAVALQVFARIMAATPLGSPTWRYLLNGFTALGDTASCTTVWLLSLPWMAAAELSVTQQYGWNTIVLLLVSIAMVPLSIVLLVHVDARAMTMCHRREQERLRLGAYEQDFSTDGMVERVTSARRLWRACVDRRLPNVLRDAAGLIERQGVSVSKYKGTILFSFLVPALLSLSPLVTGQVTEQWFYVVGGIALCSMLLAPPALRIDFRRDLRRMMLLRSLPVQPLSMVLGQLTLPILITLIFQWVTLAIAAYVTQPGWGQVVMWTCMLASLAVFTFACENALFLAYPHHERAEGIAMMIRAKLTFLGKAAVMATSLALLVAWSVVCGRWFPEPLVTTTFVAGAVLGTGVIAACSIAVTTWCWRRFDFSYDVPPE
ncbi:MAG: hypothetical protein HKN47_02495 [Pirellulaceae bacterium]|nr:hypothetical protein [Pirellulaceae bacterium]